MSKMGQEYVRRLEVAAPELLEALIGLLRFTRSMSHREHHNLCYGLDIEAHPDCELCKLITKERIAEQAIAKVCGVRRCARCGTIRTDIIDSDICGSCADELRTG